MHITVAAARPAQLTQGDRGRVGPCPRLDRPPICRNRASAITPGECDRLTSPVSTGIWLAVSPCTVKCRTSAERRNASASTSSAVHHRTGLRGRPRGRRAGTPTGYLASGRRSIDVATPTQRSGADTARLRAGSAVWHAGVDWFSGVPTLQQHGGQGQQDHHPGDQHGAALPRGEVRTGCTDLASRRAPTSCSGARCRRRECR